MMHHGGYIRRDVATYTDEEGDRLEALRDCVALRFGQGEVRHVRSLPEAALLAVGTASS